MYFTLVKGRDTEHLTLLLALPPVFSFLSLNSTGSIIFRAVEFNPKLTHPSRILLLCHSNDVIHSHPITRTCTAQSPFAPIRVCKAASTVSPRTILAMWLAMYYESLPLCAHALQMFMGIHSTWTFSLSACAELRLVVESDFCLPMMKERTFLSGEVFLFFFSFFSL